MSEDSFTVTQATEHSLYKGLDPYFARVQAIENKETRDRMIMVVLELDCALDAQEAGHKDTAVQHFKNVQQLARRVMNGQDNRSGASKDVRDIMSELMRGSVNDGKEPKPWSKTLSMIAEENNARMSAGMDLQLAPITMKSSAFVAPQRDETITLFDVQHIQPAPAMLGAIETHKKPAADYVWARPEYEALATALQPLLDRKGGEDYRKDALVAMICLRTVNNTEKGIISVGKNSNNKEELEKYSEFRGRLAEYIGKLNQDHGFTKGEQQKFQHLHQPVADHARNFEKTMKSGSVLSRVFAFASSLKSRFMGPSAPAHDKVEQKSLPAPKV